MRSEHETIEGDLYLTEDLELHGVVVGSISVPDGIVLELYGMVTSDLIVWEGGTANVYGRVIGTVYSFGGATTVKGTVGAVEGSVEVRGIITGLDWG